MSGNFPGHLRSRSEDLSRALTRSDSYGKVVCEWESPGKSEVAAAYQKLGFPFDEIVQVDAICDAGAEGVTTNDL
jgi:hypothetical protein